MTFYADMAATAQELLAEFGAPAELKRTVPGAYDPNTGGTSGETTASYGCMAFIGRYAIRDVDGTRIQASDRRVYLAPDIAVLPQPGDVLVVGGVSLVVIASNPIAPAGAVLLHDVQARGQ